MMIFHLTIRFLIVFYKTKNTFLLPGLPGGSFACLIKSSSTAAKGIDNKFWCDVLYNRRLTAPESNILNNLMRVFPLVEIALTRNRSVKTITSHKINALKSLA